MRLVTILAIILVPQLGFADGTERQDRLELEREIMRAEEARNVRRVEEEKEERIENRNQGIFLEEGARFPYRMSFSEGKAEAKRMVRLIEAQDEDCLTVLWIEEKADNVTFVGCHSIYASGFRSSSLPDTVWYDVVEREDGISVYQVNEPER